MPDLMFRMHNCMQRIPNAVIPNPPEAGEESPLRRPDSSLSLRMTKMYLLSRFTLHKIHFTFCFRHLYCGHYRRLHTIGIGDVSANNVESRPVGGRGPDYRYADSDINSLVEIEQLDRNHRLVGIHCNDAVEFPVASTQK